MTAQDLVLARFPVALAREEQAVFVYDVDAFFEESYWAIYSGPEVDDEELGRGKSESEAWSDAAGQRGNQAA
jgi:hypothetical protein